MIELKSQIVVVDDFEKIFDFLKESIKDEFLHIINCDEFKVEDAKEAIKEAYLSSSEDKYIVLAAKKYNIYSQNALLKILEEPPKNVVFIILTRSKSSLLPTIRSRLPVVVKKDKKGSCVDIDIKEIDLRFIYNFLQENKNIKKDEAKDVIKSILDSAYKRDLRLKEDELNLFLDAIKLLELNSNPLNILTTIFLTILEAKRR